MKKIFISMPMRGKSLEQIEKERNEIVRDIEGKFKGQFEILDTIFDLGEDAKPLEYLGEALKVLATADIAYFGKGWEDARGCKIENTCAKEYGIEVVEI